MDSAADVEIEMENIKKSNRAEVINRHPDDVSKSANNVALVDETWSYRRKHSAPTVVFCEENADLGNHCSIRGILQSYGNGGWHFYTKEKSHEIILN